MEEAINWEEIHIPLIRRTVTIQTGGPLDWLTASSVIHSYMINFESISGMIIDVVKENPNLHIKRDGIGEISVYGKDLELSVRLTHEGKAPLWIEATVYRDGSRKTHSLETNDSEAAINYVYFLLCITDPQRGKWIKL